MQTATGSFQVERLKGRHPVCDPQLILAKALAAQAANHLGAAEGEAFDALTLLPENMLSLLDGPQGWTALVEYIAGELGCRSSVYKATLH